MARNPEIEAAIIASPENDELYRAYADWLEQHGDRRAELIRLQLADRFGTAQGTFLSEHEEELVGSLQICKYALMWKAGFVDYADLREDTNLRAGPSLEALVAHPAGAFLQSLQIITFDPAAVVEPLARVPATLRYLDFFSPTQTAVVHGLGHVFARLKRLILDGRFELTEPLELPQCLELAIELDGMSANSAEIVANVNAPQLMGLTLGINETVDARAKLAPLFARDLPELRGLVIAEGDLDDICELLAAAPFARKLAHLTLDVTAGSLGSRGIEALRDNRLSALQELHVEGSINHGLLAPLERPGLKLSHE